MSNIPSEFISLETVCPGLHLLMSYSTVHNFTGQVVRGYKAKKAYLLRPVADALRMVQLKAEKRGYGIKIFDAYRPVKAVDFFQEWALQSETNPEIKVQFYPKFSRSELFEAGYIAKQSSHSRGCAIDLTLYDLRSGKDLDMGSKFDFFDEISSTDFAGINAYQKENRYILKMLMESHGFKNFSKEWWHYSLKPDAFTDQAFNFDVE